MTYKLHRSIFLVTSSDWLNEKWSWTSTNSFASQQFAAYPQAASVAAVATANRVFSTLDQQLTSALVLHVRCWRGGLAVLQSGRIQGPEGREEVREQSAETWLPATHCQQDHLLRAVLLHLWRPLPKYSLSPHCVNNITACVWAYLMKVRTTKCLPLWLYFFFPQQDMASLNLNEGSSGGGSEQDTLAPLPPTSNPWPLGGQPFPYPPFPSAPPSFPPGYSDPCHSFHSGSAGSQHSEGEWWGGWSRRAFDFPSRFSFN